MKFKPIIVKYALAGSLLVAPKSCGDVHDCGGMHAQTANKIENTDNKTQESLIQEKAQKLCDTYIRFVLQGQKNIQDGTGPYFKRVKQELPNAPVGYHCIFGQYTQLNRALQDLGDNFSLIPFTARNSCPRFRSEMQQKYNHPEYVGAIHNGKMFKSDSEYDRALSAFLRYNHINDSTPASTKQAVIKRFEKNNFKVSDLHPGTILIIQKSTNPNNTHAVMFLGRGRIEKNKFIPDSNGAFLCAGYNRESVRDIFTTWNTDRIFAVDIYDIAYVAYTKEFEKIQQKSLNDLFYYVYNTAPSTHSVMPSREQLEDMAKEKFFDNQTFMLPPQINQAGIVPNLLQYSKTR